MKQFASGRSVFYFMSVIYNWSDMEMRNSRTLDKNRKEEMIFLKWLHRRQDEELLKTAEQVLKDFRNEISSMAVCGEEREVLENMISFAEYVHGRG